MSWSDGAWDIPTPSGANAGVVGGNSYNASWTVGTTDLGGEADYNSSSAGVATIPQGLTSTVGAVFSVRQMGTGPVTIAAGSNVTVTGAVTTTGRGQTLYARQTATDTWAVTGSIGSPSGQQPLATSLMPLWMPASAISENFPRFFANNGDTAITSGTPYLFPGPVCPAGVSVGHIMMYISGTGAASQTHAWAALLNPANGTVLAVTADLGSTAVGGGSTFTTTGWALSAAYVPAEDTPTMVAICVTAGTLPTFRGLAQATTGGIAPVTNGSSAGGAKQTPPSVGGTVSLPSSLSGAVPYCYLLA